jgi:anti-sigma regulatory factor (Ser/Thr protein kinase)
LTELFAADPVAAGIGDDPFVGAFRHEALLYADPDEFMERAAAFIQGGLAAREPVFVLLAVSKIESLRRALGRAAGKVLWGDMTRTGRNPARIISVWRDFVADHAEFDRVRGIAEPIWPERTAEELVESQRHESLVNLAFAGVPAWILCFYDLSSLAPSVIDEAHRSHPLIAARGTRRPSATFRDLEEIALPFDDPLIEPASAEEVRLTTDGLSAIRALVAQRAGAAGLSPERIGDVVLAVNEVVTNSLRHGAGRAALRIWWDEAELVCEVTDEGKIDLPLAGRQRPTIGGRSGYGLWIANQLSDLVQLRSFPTGSVVRLHVSRR